MSAESAGANRELIEAVAALVGTGPVPLGG